MAQIVYLNDRTRKPRSVTEIPAGGATIHLFLGVRYERHDDQPRVERPTSPVSGGNRRKARKRA